METLISFILACIVVFFILKASKPTQVKKRRYYKEDNLDQSSLLTLFLHDKRAYLKSPEWKAKRLLVLKRDNYTCQSCGSKEPLHVHHMSAYDRIPNEPLSSLISLCASCHTHQHQVYGYPQTYKEYMEWDTQLTRKHNVTRTHC